ncbi:MAG: hypothetical protein IJU60_05025 [Acholeplasmatales bacterium]|nr:hypothetical protein [Acholeplasmatales bacterium]
MKLKRFVIAGLAGVAALSLVSCGGGADTSPLDPTGTDTQVYNKVLGAFNTKYQDALGQTTDLNKRYALQAQAEAKLMESGTMLPTTTQGGNYAVTRVAPRTVNSTLWGNDEARLYSTVVSKTPIKKADRAAMIANWNAHRAEADYDHTAYVKQYLTSHGYEQKTTYDAAYTSDPDTYDVLATSKAADSEVLVNLYDGLLVYNQNNVQVGAIATALPTITKRGDNQVFTFTLRQGVKWVTNTGADSGYTVKAADFVTGFQHMLDAEGGLESLTYGVVKGASDYAKNKDASKLGVKAVDDYTVEYELEGTVPYFQSMFAYSLFAPLQKAFYESKGGKFGAEFDSTAETYKYGDSAANILYNGPFRLTATDKETQIVFEQNADYYNKNAVNVTKITWKYNDGKDAKKAYNDFKAGTVDGAGLSSAVLPDAKQDKLGTDTDTIFNTYSYETDTNATTFVNFFNVNRTTFTTDGIAPTTKTKNQKLTYQLASLNQNIRLGIQYAVDRKATNAISVGDELAEKSLRNSYTPYNFVSLTAPTTVSVNGTNKTYPAGTLYGQIMQDQITADGFEMKVYDATKASGDGYDGWYNAANAKARFEKGLAEVNAELKAANLPEISSGNKLVVEYATQSSSTIYMGKAQALKKSVEAALGEWVEIRIVGLEQRADWLKVCYSYSDGAHANFDINDLSGWGPDYGDPQTYLDTMLPDGDGYMVKALGLF